MNQVEAWYDNQYDEWERLGNHRIEFEITKRYLNVFLPADSQRILDVGGGPGRYSIYLAEKGHRLTLLDLSKTNVDLAKAKAEERGVSLEAAIHGNALDLSQIQGKFDHILLMGPLYHLLDEADRKQAIAEALRLLEPGGLIFAAFISSYAPLQDYLKSLYPLESPDDVLSYLDDGRNTGDEGFTLAYFSGIQEARDLMNSFGLEEVAFVGIENILSSREQAINQMEEEAFNRWLEVCYRLGQDENLMGCSEHLLYIGRASQKIS